MGHTLDEEIAHLSRVLDRASEAGQWDVVRELRADLARLREERAGAVVADRLVAKVTTKG